MRAMGSNKATAGDVSVGLRLRERRVALGLSGQEFAELIGISCQQAHKYERGANRIPAARLYGMAEALDTPITYFYEGSTADAGVIRRISGLALEMVRDFAAI